MTTQTVGQLTEIQVDEGGGKYLTQSAPTNFHQFWTKKVLTATESAGDFKEVTASEMNTIKAKDEKWTPPSEELIATATAAGAVYNHKTGFFELNGLTDLTEADMRTIMDAGKRQTSTASAAYISLSIRTHLPRVGQGQATSCSSTFYMCGSLESVNFANAKLQGDCFTNCYKLRRVVGVYDRNNSTTENFRGCSALEELKGEIRSNNSFSLSSSPKLTLESIQYIVTNAHNSAPITITLHPTAYARLTDELIAQAATKKITFATT